MPEGEFVLVFSGVGSLQVPFPYFTYVNPTSSSPLMETHHTPSLPHQPNCTHVRVERWDSALTSPYYNPYVKGLVPLKVMLLGSISF